MEVEKRETFDLSTSISSGSEVDIRSTGSSNISGIWEEVKRDLRRYSEGQHMDLLSDTDPSPRQLNVMPDPELRDLSCLQMEGGDSVQLSDTHLSLSHLNVTQEPGLQDMAPPCTQGDDSPQRSDSQNTPQQKLQVSFPEDQLDEKLSWSQWSGTDRSPHCAASPCPSQIPSEVDLHSHSVLEESAVRDRTVFPSPPKGKPGHISPALKTAPPEPERNVLEVLLGDLEVCEAQAREALVHECQAYETQVREAQIHEAKAQLHLEVQAREAQAKLHHEAQARVDRESVILEAQDALDAIVREHYMQWQHFQFQEELESCIILESLARSTVVALATWISLECKSRATLETEHIVWWQARWLGHEAVRLMEQRALESVRLWDAWQEEAQAASAQFHLECFALVISDLERQRAAMLPIFDTEAQDLRRRAILWHAEQSEANVWVLEVKEMRMRIALQSVKEAAVTALQAYLRRLHHHIAMQQLALQRLQFAEREQRMQVVEMELRAWAPCWHEWQQFQGLLTLYRKQVERFEIEQQEEQQRRQEALKHLESAASRSSRSRKLSDPSHIEPGSLPLINQIALQATRALREKGLKASSFPSLQQRHKTRAALYGLGSVNTSSFMDAAPFNQSLGMDEALEMVRVHIHIHTHKHGGSSAPQKGALHAAAAGAAAREPVTITAPEAPLSELPVLSDVCLGSQAYGGDEIRPPDRSLPPMTLPEQRVCGPSRRSRTQEPLLVNGQGLEQASGVEAGQHPAPLRGSKPGALHVARDSCNAAGGRLSAGQSSSEDSSTSSSQNSAKAKYRVRFESQTAAASRWATETCWHFLAHGDNANKRIADHVHPETMNATYPYGKRVTKSKHSELSYQKRLGKAHKWLKMASPAPSSAMRLATGPRDADNT